MLRGILALLILNFTTEYLISQVEPVIFSIDGKPVGVSEFEYIYNKNNGKEANYSKASLDEYLNLYIKFKLKVQAAKDMKLDTIPALIKELDGYRQQLTTNYLNDKEVVDKLAREVYERQKVDLKISHILISTNNSNIPSDTLTAYNKAMEVYKNLQATKDFQATAKKYSEDKNTAQQGGALGWFTAMLPDGFYNLENAIYSLKVGEYTLPIRTRIGYQIVQLNSMRNARRKMEVAHILIRKSLKGKIDEIARMRADSLYNAIKSGSSFEELARLFSNDNTTNMTGGNIGYISIGQLESNFEDAAFSIPADGEISKPIETNIGWHIIKRLKKEEEIPYERAKRKIQSDINRDSRFKQAQSSLIEKIKMEAGYKENQLALDRMAMKLDSTYFTYKWIAPENIGTEPVATLAKSSINAQEFLDYLKSNPRQRVQGAEDKNIKLSLKNLLGDFVSQKCLQYEENRLEDKYPDFKALMREYREGILLFEATKNVVWDRASDDTVGLKLFYKKNKMNYIWDDRIVVHTINIDTSNEKLVNKIYKTIQKKGINKAIDKYDSKKQFISYQKNTIEKKNEEAYTGLKFEKGFTTALSKDPATNSFYFKRVEDLLPKTNKTIDEARGFIIADYQEYLESIWINDLKNKYKVEINQETLSKLVKK
ncbi:MAG: peptidylprolyl isomerase [Saprospiraceae bacterium]|nr:peptidylprolyl isomerase [Saprospiraceae bacterium]